MHKGSDDQPDRNVAKRLFDLFFAAFGLVVLSPVFLLIGLVVGLSDPGPVLFSQERVGQWGKRFRMLKFRSMVTNASRTGLSLTRDGDPRVTRVGRFLRKTKLDELPQLWNVFRGDMSFVGPRPEVPEYVDRYTPEQRKVLSLKPGITDLATLEFRNEEELLSQAKDGALEEGHGEGGEEGRAQRADVGVEEFYVQYCIPRKIELNLAYACRANVWEDFKIILRTLFSCAATRAKPPATGPHPSAAEF